MNECIDGWPYHLVLKLGPHLGPTDNNHITRLVAGGWWLVAGGLALSYDMWLDC
jgi:hypothetical protein